MRLTIRPMAPTDRNFVIESWISSYRRSPHSGLIPMAMWHEVMAPIITRIIDRPDVRTIVAADADATDHTADLFGWMTWMPREHPPLVFFTYVKHAARYDIQSRTGARIATRLFRHAQIDPRAPFNYVCNTHVVGTLAAAGKIPKAKWRPLLGRFPKEHHGRTAEELDADAA